jgi:hypothetical protein
LFAFSTVICCPPKSIAGSWTYNLPGSTIVSGEYIFQRSGHFIFLPQGFPEVKLSGIYHYQGKSLTLKVGKVEFRGWWSVKNEELYTNSTPKQVTFGVT